MIAATLPRTSSSRIGKIDEMIIAGCNVFRLNFSHVSDPDKELESTVRLIRQTSQELNIPVGILADLCGPKIRTSIFADPGYVEVRTGERLKLVYHPTEHGGPGKIVTSIPQVCKQLEPGHRVLFDDGNLRAIVVEKISDVELIVEMENSWKLKSKKGINVPDIALDLSCVTEKDKRDLEFVWKWRLDFVAMSFVQRRADVEDLRQCIEKFRLDEISGEHYVHTEDVSLELADGKLRVNPETWKPLIISKIETPGGLQDVDAILEVSDGIMVARGDLGVELSLEVVPLAQKELIEKANRAGKPVITATQMMESMISAPVPTRAEVSDVANSVFDGTDAVMLSGEAAVGAYPVETVKMMSTVCISAEHQRKYTRAAPQVDPVPTSGWTHTSEPIVPEDFRHAIADGAVAIGKQAHAEAILTLTTTGDMATLISKRRPNVPIIAATGSPAAYFRMTLLYGVTPLYAKTLAQVHDTSPEERSHTLEHHAEKKAAANAQNHESLTLDRPPSALSEGQPSDPIRRIATPGTLQSVLSQDHPHRPRRLLPSTDVVLAEVESEARGMLKDGAVVVTASGYVHGLPGLSEICRLSRFGQAIIALRARSHWKDAYATVLARRQTPDFLARRTPDISGIRPGENVPPLALSQPILLHAATEPPSHVVGSADGS